MPTPLSMQRAPRRPGLRDLVGFAAMVVALVLPGPALAQSSIVTCETQMVPVRDGTKLYTEIYRPIAPGRYSVQLNRSPYGRLLGDGCFVSISKAAAEAAALSGYVTVFQEVRGTMRSEGTFHPFFQEQNDGHDMVEWAASQPWSDGRVGFTGASYPGAVVWQGALTVPRHLRAVVTGITASDYHDDWTARNGVFDLDFDRGWGLLFVPDFLIRTLQASGTPPAQIAQEVGAWYALQAQNKNWNSFLPLAGNWGDTVIGTTGLTIRQLAPYIWTWYEHPTYDAYWGKIDVEQHWDDVKVPALVTGGWYDLFAVGTINNYIGMHAEGGSPEARRGSMLVMDCCGHGFYAPPVPGAITWGANRTDLTLSSRFLDHYVKGAGNGVQDEPHVQLTVLVPPDTGTAGDNFVLKTSDYPVPGTQYRKYCFSSGGRANTLSGDGVLLASGKHRNGHGPEHGDRDDDDDETCGDGRAGGGTPDRFDYDPLNPVPTVGGNDNHAAEDQTAVEHRPDILVYTGPKLEEDLAVIGRVKVTFWAMTSARDTDFTVKLVDVHPDGYAHNVVDRIIRARYRRGSKWPAEFIQPNRPYEYSMLVGDTATIFKKGHKIRVEVSSSSFPHYARNLNTGLSNEDTAETVVAHQTILHHGRHASFIELPIVPWVKAP